MQIRLEVTPYPTFPPAVAMAKVVSETEDSKVILLEESYFIMGQKMFSEGDMTTLVHNRVVDSRLPSWLENRNGGLIMANKGWGGKFSEVVTYPDYSNNRGKYGQARMTIEEAQQFHKEYLRSQVMGWEEYKKYVSPVINFTEELGSDIISEMGSSSDWDESDPDEVNEAYDESLREWLDILTAKQLIRLNFYLDGESINEYKKMGLLEPDIIETTIEELKKRLIEDFKEELSSYDFDDIASARNSHLEYLYESRYD
jgi:hypothetical protein|tara:strand:- start:420 stop:1190 length:771 start_codon:yes stop_codon:yes gene_type:complete